LKAASLIRAIRPPWASTGSPGDNQAEHAETSGDTNRLTHQPGTAASVWIDLPSADRQSLGDLGGQVGLPLELITYCLLDQRRPKVVPCAAWLYSAWQVPVFAVKASPGNDDVFYRFVEIKACLGPVAVVTTQGRVRRAKRPLASLVSDGDALVREGPGNLLVTLVERVGDAYVALKLAVDPTVESDVRTRHGRQALTTAGTRLLRHARAHRDAVQKLIVRGRRWLDAGEVERLKRVADRLASLGADPSPPAGGPDAA
jgi:Mg2+ and Co2+ transporter CorA